MISLRSRLFYISLLILHTSLLLAQDTLLLRVFATTDVHGVLMPFDLIENKPRTNSLAHVHAFVEQERAKNLYQVVLLDNGDILQGDPFIYYYNFIDTTGSHALARIMNFMQYDAATMGNHDIEAGPAVYNKLMRQAKFPLLGANIIDSTFNLPYFKPYTIINRKGKKIAVLGMITPHVPKWLPRSLYIGMRFEDMITSAQGWVNHIRRVEKPDVLIGLFHTGSTRAGESPQNYYMAENAARLIAENVPGIDIIFSGHDHRRYNEFITSPDDNFTLLLSSGSHARAVAAASIKLISGPDGLTRSTEIRGDIIDLERTTPSESFTKTFQELLPPVRKFVSQHVGYLPDSLRSRDALFGFAPILGLIHQVQLDVTKAEVSFAAPLSMDVVIQKGAITWADLFKLYRYENQLYVMELSGHEIKNVLEFSYGKWLNHMKAPTDNLLLFTPESSATSSGTRGRRPQLATPFYNFESAAGINYVVDITKPVGQRIKIISMSNGKPFRAEKVYRVAVNSYRGSGGGGHLTEGAGIDPTVLPARIVWTSDKDTRFLMMQWFAKKRIAQNYVNANWSIIPTVWAEKAKARDFRLLFE